MSEAQNERLMNAFTCSARAKKPDQKISSFVMLRQNSRLVERNPTSTSQMLTNGHPPALQSVVQSCHEADDAHIRMGQAHMICPPAALKIVIHNKNA